MARVRSQGQSPIPVISTSVIAEDSDDNFHDDVMTADEENAALKYLSSDTGGKVHRLSSLDVYLLNEKSAEQSESFLLNRRRSLRIEEQEVNMINQSFEEKVQEEKKRQIEETKLQIKEERERKKKEREEALQKKHQFEQKIFNKRKRKGLGRMSREKRNRLKKLIMQKVHEEMLSERKQYETQRRQEIEKNVPKLELDNLNEEQLIKTCQEFHEMVKQLESKKYEIQQKINFQENELNELTRKLSELPGKYPIPILKKVSKRESRLAKLLRNQGRASSVDVASYSQKHESSTEPLDKIYESHET